MNSIVDYLKQQGQDSSFSSRRKIAESYGLQGYSGTSEQNLQLLNLLQNNSNASNSPTSTPINPLQQANPINQGFNSQIGQPVISVQKALQPVLDNSNRILNAYNEPIQSLNISDYLKYGFSQVKDNLFSTALKAIPGIGLPLSGIYDINSALTKTNTKTAGINTDAIRQAITTIESGGNWRANSDAKTGTHTPYSALGRYQIVPKYWFGAIGLNPESPQDRERFLNSPELQNKALDAIIADYGKKSGGDIQKFGQLYFGGEAGTKNLNATDKFGRLTTGTYGQKLESLYNKYNTGATTQGQLQGGIGTQDTTGLTGSTGSSITNSTGATNTGSFIGDTSSQFSNNGFSTDQDNTALSTPNLSQSLGAIDFSSYINPANTTSTFTTEQNKFFDQYAKTLQDSLVGLDEANQEYLKNLAEETTRSIESEKALNLSNDGFIQRYNEATGIGRYTPVQARANITQERTRFQNALSDIKLKENKLVLDAKTANLKDKLNISQQLFNLGKDKVSSAIALRDKELAYQKQLTDFQTEQITPYISTVYNALNGRSQEEQTQILQNFAKNLNVSPDMLKTQVLNYDSNRGSAYQKLITELLQKYPDARFDSAAIYNNDINSILNSIRTSSQIYQAETSGGVSGVSSVDTAAQDNIFQTESILRSINESINNDDGFTDVVGAGFQKIIPGIGTEENPFISGTKAADFYSKMNQLKNLLALPGLANLKGATSDKDIIFLKNISTSLSPSLSETEFKREISRVEETLNRVKARYGLGVTSNTTQSNTTTTEDPLGIL